MKEFTLTAIYEAVCQCHDTVDDYTFNNVEEVEQYKREKVVFNRFRQEWQNASTLRAPYIQKHAID